VRSIASVRNQARKIGSPFHQYGRSGESGETQRIDTPERIPATRLEFTVLLRCGVALMSWDLKFREPILVPEGKPLVTLRDAGEYVRALSAETHAQPAWQTAMHVLIQTADHSGPIEFARLGMVQALHPKGTPVYRHVDKDTKWRHNYKLVRDR
jgi:hypothetical protein